MTAWPARDALGAITRPRELAIGRSELDPGGAPTIGDLGNDADRTELDEPDVAGVSQVRAGGVGVASGELFEFGRLDQIRDRSHERRIRRG
jgi:hypothetical protein